MSSDSKSPSRLALVAVCLGITTALLAIYWQTSSFDFVNWDDDAYIYENPEILRGLTLENAYRAFASTQNYLWHPIATLTHLVDVELYGVKAGGHHVTNVLIHIAGSLLLFFALKRLTGEFYPSAFAAGLFALHPLRVESVAWVTERKDVLTGLFFATLLWVYADYARRPSYLRYCLVALAFVLGAMSKPSFVTVPFALLLIDYWPLRRDSTSLDGNSNLAIWSRLIVEKIPLMLVSAIVCAVTVQAQKTTAMVTLTQIPIGERLVNAGRSYWIYLTQFFWPTDLAAFYTYQRGNPAFWQGVAAWFIVLMITTLVLRFGKKRRYLLVGWFWYLGMLVPMIGLAQAGTQAHADRFTYLPQIGIAIAITWGVSEWARHISFPRRLLGAICLVVLVALSAASWRQTRYWRDGVTLFTRAVDPEYPSAIIYNNLGVALDRQGREAESAEMYHRAVQLDPKYASAMINLGDTLRTLGQLDNAVLVLKRAVELAPDATEVANNLAASYIHLGRYDEAIEQLKETQKRFPEYVPGVVNLGLAYFRKGVVDEAIVYYRKALELDSNSAGAYANLAIALAHQKKRDVAVEAFRESIRIRPDDVDTLMSAAWVVATDPNASEDTCRESLEWAKRGVGLTDGNNPVFQMMLAASHAANREFEMAISVAEQVEKLAMQQGNVGVAETVRAHVKLYRINQPVR